MKQQLTRKIEELKGRRFKVYNFVIIGLIFNGFVLVYDLSFIIKGGFALANSINDRATLLAALDDPRYMWFIKYIYTAYSCSAIFILWVKFKSLSIQARSLFLLINLPVVFYWFIFFAVGNRREFVYVFLFILALFLLKENVKALKFAVWGFIAMVLFLILGLYRTGLTLQTDLKLILTNGLGDFIIPHNTFVYYYSTGVDNLYGGLTYFSFLFLFIPRFLWASKPISLAVDFVNDLDLPMGFGFSPVAEAYLNFGDISVILFPLSIILLVTVIYRLNRVFPFLYIFLFIQILNLNRGELSAVISEIIIMYLIFNLIYKLSFSNGPEKSQPDIHFQQ
jgi:oligosaccharide repeat unit polymerase